MRNKLTALLRYQLPQFVREDHDLFVAFVQAYYEWMEEEGHVLSFIQQFEENMDVDLASDDFIDQFIKELAVTFPKNVLIDKDMLLKIIKEFYIAKGSEQAFHFLFTILYNTTIDIQYPKIFLQGSSGGDYQSNDYAYITGDNAFKLDLSDDDDLAAEVEGITSGAKAVIDTIVKTFFNNQLILILDISSYQGIFIPEEEVYLRVGTRQIKEKMFGVLNKIQVSDGGTNYKNDDEIIITDTNGQRAKAKIKRLDKGPLDSITIDAGGLNYEVGQLIKATPIEGSPGYGFLGEIMAVDVSGAITAVRVINGGYDYKKKTYGIVKNTVGTGAILTLNGDKIGKIVEIEVYDSGINYWNEATINISITSDDGVGFVGTPILTGIFNEPKSYKDTTDFLSNYNKIRDSYYYQEFSYVIRSNVSPGTWLGTINRIAHPAGMKLFGSLLIESEFDISVELPLGFVTSLTIIKKIFNDIEITNAIEYEHDEIVLILEEHDLCSLDLTLHDLDVIKFFDTFEWTIEPFVNYTISDVVTRCQPLMKYMDGATIKLNHFGDIDGYSGGYSDGELENLPQFDGDGYSGGYSDTDLTTV